MKNLRINLVSKYNSREGKWESLAQKKSPQSKNQQININLDTTPIFYTDKIGITVNSNGVVFDVMQRVGPTSKVRIVSRIGMSKTHAEKFVQELGKLLAMTQGSIQKKSRAN